MVIVVIVVIAVVCFGLCCHVKLESVDVNEVQVSRREVQADVRGV